ncbi:MAG: uncharacterized protein KVP18_002006 [Porospora cf. gigantea A]|uniref:uncharacterized protein n=1 Tax=Porospora cf. gigantea A TaxID=2853593 RepID=UPI00355A4F1F|nr:MAG: hypothetical protein KVP18_002006 [Porospora cf. gigantea A]
MVSTPLQVNEAVVKFLESIDGEELIKVNMKIAMKEVDNGAAFEAPVARLSVMLRAPINRPDST